MSKYLHLLFSHLVSQHLHIQHSFLILGVGIICSVMDYSFLHLPSALKFVTESWAVMEREMTCMCKKLCVEIQRYLIRL